MAADKGGGGGGWGVVWGAELPVWLELNCGGLSSITILFAQGRGAKSLLAGLSPAFSSSLPLLGGTVCFCTFSDLWFPSAAALCLTLFGLIHK